MGPWLSSLDPVNYLSKWNPSATRFWVSLCYLFDVKWEENNIKTPLGTKEPDVSKEMGVSWLLIASYKLTVFLVLYSCSLIPRIMITLLGWTSQLGKLRFRKVNNLATQLALDWTVIRPRQCVSRWTSSSLPNVLGSLAGMCRQHPAKQVKSGHCVQ